MAKRLRVEAEIPLPADPFEEADAMSKMREPIAELRSSVEASGGKVTHSVVAERAPSKKKGHPADQEAVVDLGEERRVSRHGHAAE